MLQSALFRDLTNLGGFIPARFCGAGTPYHVPIILVTQLTNSHPANACADHMCVTPSAKYQIKAFFGNGFSSDIGTNNSGCIHI